jgi:hypothetical protein
MRVKPLEHLGQKTSQTMHLEAETEMRLLAITSQLAPYLNRMKYVPRE